MEIRNITGGVTAAKGFMAASCAAGIKYKNRADMAMVYSSQPCCAAGTFTNNVVKAAPVQWDMDVVAKNCPVQAVVINSGIANAGTGKKGMQLCEQTARETAGQLGIAPTAVLIGSTGVIGPDIPLDKITAGVAMLKARLSDTTEAGTEASRAIMTTDTVNKEFACEFDLPAAEGGGLTTVRLGGMSKGSGMIHPNMSTMLAYLTTDADIDRALLQKAVSAVIPDTFNMISVDGDTSTNDTFFILANGLAGNKKISEEDGSFDIFCRALFDICLRLAVTMARDGEGATRLIETRVFNADTKENARALAKSVVGSSLVKAMIYGKDANCGRVLCALGYAGPRFDPDIIEIRMAGEHETVLCYAEGHVLRFDEELALRIMNEDSICFEINMNMGSQEATAWGCDLTYDYVKINGDYRT